LHDGQATQVEGTLLQYTEVMATHAWVTRERPGYYASTLIGRLDHTSYIRGQRQGHPHTYALLGVLERLLRARYFIATVHAKALESLFPSLKADVDAAAEEVGAVLASMNKLLTADPRRYRPVPAAKHKTALAFPEDAPGLPRLGHPTTVGGPSVEACLALIHNVALRAEWLLPVAEAFDNTSRKALSQAA
jgi:hypothetical protein